MTKGRVIGRNTAKVDGTDKVTGVAQFGADVYLPGMLVGKILRSPYAHARIQRIDTSRAKALEGVKAVITGQDFLAAASAADREGGTTSRGSYLREKVMASDKALFHGHPIAAVAATTADIAEEALALIEVEYQPLPHVLDPVASMGTGAPLLHQDLFTRSANGASPTPSNVAEHLHMGRGDVKDGFAMADVVVERHFKTHTVHQGYIEPDSETAFARPDGSLVVWANTQAPYTQRTDLSELLGIPENSIRVVPMEVGGAFGGKESVRVSAICSALSLKARRPVKITLTREEVLRASWPATAIDATIKVGARRDGLITAIQARIVYDAGAFPGAPLRSALRRVFSLYRTPNLAIDAFDVVTNKPPVAAYRAPGATPTAFALESVIDEVADALGMDPLEFRLKNVSRPGDPMPDGTILPTINLAEVLERVKRHPCWTTPLTAPNQGRGLALGLWTMPGGTTACRMNLNVDGSVTLVLGTVDLSATRTTLAQIAAEALGLDLADVRVVVADTNAVGYSDPSAGDRVTYVASKAVLRASQDLLDKLTAKAAEELQVSQQDILYERKLFWVREAPEMKLTLPELARRCVRRSASLVGYGSASEVTGRTAIAPNAAAHVVDVEVDPETGKVRILRYTAFQDVGRAVNPVQVEGQLQGGSVQGIGWALMEAFNYDEKGALRNASLLDYRLPTTLDVPPIDTEVLEIPSPDHPQGIRGVGQVPIVPPAGAIANAIYRAVGVRLRELPMTPESVFWALKKKTEEAKTA